MTPEQEALLVGCARYIVARHKQDVEYYGDANMWKHGEELGGIAIGLALLLKDLYPPPRVVVLQPGAEITLNDGSKAKLPGYRPSDWSDDNPPIPCMHPDIASLRHCCLGAAHDGPHLFTREPET